MRRLMAIEILCEDVRETANFHSENLEAELVGLVIVKKPDTVCSSKNTNYKNRER